MRSMGEPRKRPGRPQGSENSGRGWNTCVHFRGDHCEILTELSCAKCGKCNFYITPAKWAENQKKYPGFRR